MKIIVTHEERPKNPDEMDRYLKIVGGPEAMTMTYTMDEYVSIHVCDPNDETDHGLIMLADIGKWVDIGLGDGKTLESIDIQQRIATITLVAGD